MIKLDKKGMTMVEIILSVALISIVLIFLMGLFLKVRGTYNMSKIQSNYDMLGSNIIKAIGNDIDNYGLKDVRYETAGDKSSVVLTFNTFRPQHLSERIQKVLRVYFKNNIYYISYAYESQYTSDITSVERVSGVIRELPSDVVIDSSNYIELTTQNLGNGDRVVGLKVPMSTEKGNVYDINVYGLIKKSND